MSGDESRIDVYVNVNDSLASISTDRLNRVLRDQPASITELDLSESSSPGEPTDFRMDGEIHGAVTKEVDIPNEIYAVGKAVELIQRDTPCLIEETAVDSSNFEREFTLYGHIDEIKQ